MVVSVPNLVFVFVSVSVSLKLWQKDILILFNIINAYSYPINVISISITQHLPNTKLGITLWLIYLSFEEISFRYLPKEMLSVHVEGSKGYFSKIHGSMGC